MKGMKASPGKIIVRGAKLTRGRAEKISAVEGLKLSSRMAGKFAAFDQQGLTPEQRRVEIRAEFAKKR